MPESILGSIRPATLESMKSLHLKLGTVLGIDVLLHWSFFLLPATIAWLSIREGESGGLLALKVVLMVMILGSVLWHELGHALAARAIGIPTRDILLTPICGLARLARAPDGPRDEILVALAGPVANGLIAGLTAGLAWLAGQSLSLGQDLLDLQLLAALFWVNAALCVLNLIPLFPMDGGRILRAVLAGLIDPRVATTVAARIGQAGSLGAIGYGLSAGNPAFAIIGAFLLITAEQEIRWNRLLPPVWREPGGPPGH